MSKEKYRIQDLQDLLSDIETTLENTRWDVEQMADEQNDKIETINTMCESLKISPNESPVKELYEKVYDSYSAEVKTLFLTTQQIITDRFGVDAKEML